jgi:hypothetical protein
MVWNEPPFPSVIFASDGFGMLLMVALSSGDAPELIEVLSIDIAELGRAVGAIGDPEKYSVKSLTVALTSCTDCPVLGWPASSLTGQFPKRTIIPPKSLYTAYKILLTC